MMRTLPIIFFASLILITCTDKNDADAIEVWKKEINETEQAFAKMAREQGMHKAFITYAADDAVLMRNNDLVIGKLAIDQRYEGQNSTGLYWTPDFVDVASSGDLGYTYGYYTYAYVDSTGIERVDAGVFHTVWKRQPDGSWKFVWD